MRSCVNADGSVETTAGTFPRDGRAGGTAALPAQLVPGRTGACSGSVVGAALLSRPRATCTSFPTQCSVIPAGFLSPHEFLPDRFAADKVGQIPFERALPFWTGACALCIGKSLSLAAAAQVHSALSRSSRNSRWSSRRRRRWCGPRRGLSSVPRGGLRLVVTRLHEADPQASK